MNKLTGVLRDNKIVIKTTIQSGARGPEGFSAYELWLQGGNQGTVEDYLASLKGVKGDPGEVTQVEFNGLANKVTTVETDLVAHKEDYVLDKLDYTDLNDRVDTIITTPTTEISVQEIIDARQSELSLGANLTGIKNDLATHKAEIMTQLENIEQQIEDGTAGIDDNAISLEKVWSSAKTQQLIQTIPRGERGLRGFRGEAGGIKQVQRQMLSGNGVVNLPSIPTEMDIVLKGSGLENKVKNGSFENDFDNWVYVRGNSSYSDSIVSTTSAHGAKCFKMVVNEGIGYRWQEAHFPAGNRIYICSHINIESGFATAAAVTMGIKGYGDADSTVYVSADKSIKNQWQKVSTIHSCSDSGGVRIRFGITAVVTGVCYYDKIIMIDLTSAFGAGNEPTKAQCDIMFDEWIEGAKSVIGVVNVISKSRDGTQQSQVQYIAKDKATGEVLQIQGQEEINFTTKKLITTLENIDIDVDIIGEEVNYDDGTVEVINETNYNGVIGTEGTLSIECVMARFIQMTVSETEPTNALEGDIWFKIIPKPQVPEVPVPIGDYLFRFDATKLELLEGSKVSQWGDMSGNEHNLTQVTSEELPIFLSTGLNGKPTVQFNGSILRKTPFTLDSVDGITSFLVYQMDSTETSTPLVNVGNVAYALRFSATGNLMTIRMMGHQLASISSPVTDMAFLFTGTYTPTNSTAYKNGVYERAMAHTQKIGTHNMLTLGDSIFKGRISEVIHFSRVLSVDEIGLVNTYLTNKWGI